MPSMARGCYDDPVWAINWYLQGYFPLYDPYGRFYWERLPQRAVLPMTPETCRRARAMARRPRRRFRLEQNRRFDECIAHLQNPRVKEYSWVRPEVVRVYQALRRVNLLLTVEALNERGQLAGGLVGIFLPGVFIAETMFTLEADASKVCLCVLLEHLAERGFRLMDVQTRHDLNAFGEPEEHSPGDVPHPCVRLGEEVWPIGTFMRRFHTILAEAGATTAQEWVAAGIGGAGASAELRRWVGVRLET